MNNAGELVTADVWFAGPVSDDAVHAALAVGLRASGMTVVQQQRKDFTPQGMTAVWVLAESHCAVHTYPEQNYISIDCYTCGTEGRPADAIWAALDELPSHDWIYIRKHLRGIR